MKRFFITSTLVIGALASSVSAASAQTPAVTYATTGYIGNSSYRPLTLGWAFNLSASTTVTQLGVWNGGTLGNYMAGIWTIGGTSVVSTNVLSTDPVLGDYRWASIASVVLGAGDYVVGAEFRVGLVPYQAWGVVTIPSLTWIGDRQTFGGGLNFPTYDTGGGFGSNGILWANFATGANTTVPEPSTWALMLVGLAAVGVTSRRRRLAGR